MAQGSSGVCSWEGRIVFEKGPQQAQGYCRLNELHRGSVGLMPEDHMQVPLTGIEVLRYAQQDPIWDQIPKGGSKRSLDTPENRAYQVKLMKDAKEIKQMYSAFYWRRMTEEHILPFWWLNFEDDDCLIGLFRFALDLKARERVLRKLGRAADFTRDQLAWTADFSWAMAHKVTDVYDDDLGRWFSPGVAAH